MTLALGAQAARLLAAATRSSAPSRTQRRALGGIAGASDVLVLSAATITATSSFSTTSAPYNMVAIVVGALASAYAVATMPLNRPRSWTLLAAVLITLIPQTLRPPEGNMTKSDFYPWSIALGLAATVLLAASLLPVLRAGKTAVLGFGYAAMITAVVMTVPGGRRPRIDVWDIFQQSAAGLFHGVNPYEIRNFSVPAGQTANCFNYLPVSFLTGWLGWVTFSDVRYAEITIMLAGWLALLVALRPSTAAGRYGAGVLLVAMTLAGTLRVAQQAWNESIILGFVLIGAALMLSRFRGWAWLPIALALATKQHVVLLMPLLAGWPCFGVRQTVYAALGAIGISAPWLFWDFGRFKTCTVDFFIDIDSRHDSISLWRFLPHFAQSPAVLIAAAAGFYLTFRFLPRTVAGLLIGSGLVLFGFDLFNKQSFENQWWLCAELIICGLAVRSIEVTATDATPVDVEQAHGAPVRA